jgi:flagellar assembly protein FliH
MSCKLLPPGEPRAGAPVVWRQVRGEAGGTSPGADMAGRLARIEQECERLSKEAYQAGAREGEASGRKRALAELQPVMERLARSIEEIGGLRARLRGEAEADVVQLAMAIARRVLRRELAVDPEALRGLTLAALEKLQAQEIRRVRVHPSHAALVSSVLREKTGGEIEVVADASRELGSVVFETTRGNLDASVESQLREIERGLADRLRRSS